MAETLEQFRERTKFIWEPIAQDGFATSPGCANKVGKDGRLLPFYGNTTIFDLDGKDIEWLKGLQDMLYDACGDLLSERLRPETFHITLHDLLFGSDWQTMETNVLRVNEKANAIIAGIRGDFPWGVQMRARRMINMVGSSVVLVFEPIDEDNCWPVMEMYERLHDAVPLGHRLTPHVTLGYFRPGKIDREAARRLQRVFDTANADGYVLHLDVQKLNVCTFTDMNHYYPQKDSAFDLERFVHAQAGCYEQALREIRAGRKHGHWMWYCLPQLKGLGRSFESVYYGIAGMEEAKAYLAHPLLGPRLCQLAHALESLEETNPTAVMGYPDDVKLRSCMTLFEAADAGTGVTKVIEAYYGGERDEATLRMLKEE